MVEEYEIERKHITKGIIKKLEDYGYAGGLVPEDQGGLGLDYLTYGVMVEELSRTWASLRTLVTSSALATKLIARVGTPEQQEKFLPRLMAMDELACFALTEPNVGSDTRALEAKAPARRRLLRAQRHQDPDHRRQPGRSGAGLRQGERRQGTNSLFGAQERVQL